MKIVRWIKTVKRGRLEVVSTDDALSQHKRGNLVILHDAPKINKRNKKWHGNNVLEYLNQWADFDSHVQNLKGNKITEHGKGYESACKDIHDYVKFISKIKE